MANDKDNVPGWIRGITNQMAGQMARSIKHRDDVIAELRAERVELQGENEALRHDLKRAQREAAWWGSRLWLMGAKTPVPDDFDPATTVLDYDDTLRKPAGAVVGDIAALAERLARVEDKLAAHHWDVKAVHRRIDGAVETIGKRIDDLFAQSAAADATNGDLLTRVQARLATLEDLAARRGERLADLERRQELDDHARMDDDGAPPVNLTGIDGLDPVPMEETLQPIQPTHLNGLQREEVLRVKIGQLGGAEVFVAYKIGDEVRLEGATSVTGTLIPDGWYRVAGMMAQPTDNHGHTVQVATTAYTGRVPPLRWVKPGTVKEVRHGNR